MNLEEIAEVIAAQDYQKAAKLIKQINSTDRRNPQVQIYIAQVYEGIGKLEQAEQIYRQILQSNPAPKLLSQARAYLKRLQEQQKKQRQEAIAQAKAGGSDIGALILEQTTVADKTPLAQHLAQVMQIDVYTARLQLQSHGWRLYRTGAVGEMRFYSQQLSKGQIASFATAAAAVNEINVFQGHYFHSIDPPTIICHNNQENLGSLSFDWAEVSQQVMGMLPWFEEVYSMDVRRQMQHKSDTLDYIQVLDLHLPARKSIIRLCDRLYQFEPGYPFHPNQAKRQSTARNDWNHMITALGQRLSDRPLWSEFTPFGNTAIEFPEFLKSIKPELHLHRLEPTPWDAAFQLYSGSIFLQKNASDLAK